MEVYTILGATVPTIGGLHRAFDYAADWGCECFQIYLTMSRTWSSPPLSAEQRRAFLESWRSSSVQQVISHVPFLVNLASPDKTLWQKSVDRLRLEIATAVELDVRLLVLHPGSPRDSGKEDAFKRVIEAINITLDNADDTTPRILIETMAGQGTMLGSSFEDIAVILQGVEKRQFVGVCFDTAHVFAAGYNLSGYDGYGRVFKEFDSVVGVDTIGVLHINDSKTKFGSKHDRHTYVGEGEIGLETFQALLRDPRFKTTPKVLELPGRGDGVKDNLRFLRDLMHAEQGGIELN